MPPIAIDTDQPSFEQSILGNLRAADIQNGPKSELLVFASIVDEHPAPYVQAIATQEEASEQAAIAIGPQYGTVSSKFIQEATRKAIDADAPLVPVLGFAVDPQLGIETDPKGTVAGLRELRHVKVLVVRMSIAPLVDEELKETGPGTQFTFLGEPDPPLTKARDRLQVEVRGVDIYDPAVDTYCPGSSKVPANSSFEIALWMIDPDYDYDSFFVRPDYFLGDNDPYKSLKTGLKSDIDPEAWATLHRVTSVPCDTPPAGKIAIKVINSYGNEVMQAIETLMMRSSSRKA